MAKNRWASFAGKTLTGNLNVAKTTAENFVSNYCDNNQAIVVGSIRRQEAVVGDIDIVTTQSFNEIRDQLDEECKVVQGQDSRLDLDYKGFRINLFKAEVDTLGAALFHYTGPSGYVIGYKRKAKAKGLMFKNSKGIFDQQGNLVAGRTEDEIYQVLDKEYKEPQERGK